MDIFSALTTTIEITLKIQSSFEQADQNKKDGITLLTDIVNFLCSIQSCLKQQSSLLSDELCNDISNFHKELARISDNLESIFEQEEGTSWDKAVAKFKELWDAGDIKEKLIELRERVQMCHQILQLSCATRTDNAVSFIKQEMSALCENQEKTDRKFQILLDQLLGSNLTRRVTLDTVQKKLQNDTGADCKEGVADCLVGIQSTNGPQWTSTAQDPKVLSVLFTVPMTERGDLDESSKDMAKFPSNLVVQAASTSWLNSFKDQTSLPSLRFSNGCYEGSKESLQIVITLQQGGEKPSVDTSQDLLQLPQALGQLGIRTETNMTYD